MAPLYVNLIVKTEIEEDDYVKAAARIRHISKKELLRRVLKTCVRDQMVGAILDDIIWEKDKTQS